MKTVSRKTLKDLYRPAKGSHKGENGKLTIIGGSKLFHGASLWALKTASRIVDMVFYSPAKTSQQWTERLKSELYDFILVPRGQVNNYIEQSDAVLIGPGLVREGKSSTGTGETGRQTSKITHKLLTRFPHKKWVIDAGSLQVMAADWLKKLDQVIITPHQKEFNRLFKLKLKKDSLPANCQTVSRQAKQYGCVVLLKGQTDIICSPGECLINKTGNEGMSKGGTGDVLAGLTAALACKNPLFLAASASAFINGLAGDQLYRQVGPYFNASDLCDQLPMTMAGLLGDEGADED